VMAHRPAVLLVDEGHRGQQLARRHPGLDPVAATVVRIEDVAPLAHGHQALAGQDRKSTRLNSSHVKISYAVFCLKKKKNHIARVGHKNEEHQKKHAHDLNDQCGSLSIPSAVKTDSAYVLDEYI